MRKKIFVECRGCDSLAAYVIFEHRYNGLRGYCPKCEGNWPES